MDATTLYYIIIGIIIADFSFNRVQDYLNTKNWHKPIPAGLDTVYDPEEYKKSRAYDRDNDKVSLLASSIGLIAVLCFFHFSGFAKLHYFLAQKLESEIVLSLAFFGLLSMASSVLSLPFSLYGIFVIEEKYGFNKTTLKTFIADKIKGAVLGIIIGGGLLWLFSWFYAATGNLFWLWMWLVATIVMVFLNMFYTSLIAPMFNKLLPLEEGELKQEIVDYCKKVNFNLDNLFVMDGSKRTTKANAYFSGLGPKKKIVLYDNLVNNYTKEEIVAVLAHEVGHYKKKHIYQTMVLSILNVGITLYVLSLVINLPVVSNALNVETKSFHIGLVVFSFLYTPLSMLIGILMNILFRKNEYEADAFAKNTYHAKYLIAALIKLSKDSLSNLNPHKLNVFVNYSHPTLYQRKTALEK